MKTPQRVFDLIRYQLDHYAKTDAFVQKTDGCWKPVSSAECVQIISELAWGLHLAGVRAGDRVANVTETSRTEWFFIDEAVMSLGAVHVPIYPNITAPEFEFILGDSESSLLFVSSERLYQIIAPLRLRLPALRQIFTYDPVTGIKQWTQLRAAGQNDLKEPENQAVLDKIKAAVSPGDLATLIYTSGTTGTPKGVMLSHLNLISNCLACASLLEPTRRERALSFLPLCHIYERTLLNVYVYLGTSVYFAENLHTIGDDIRYARANIFATVPRLLEKIYEKIAEAGDEFKGLKRIIYFWALNLALNCDPEKPAGSMKSVELAIADLLVYSRWRKSLGGEIQAIISGSAALRPRVARLFWRARMPVYEGYGPTEASPVISVNHSAKGRCKIGTVGPVIRGGEVKIAADGEILYRGPNVMMGYYHNPEMTAEAIDKDGWLHTGDVGEFDGLFLKITDRKKEMFKTSGGKYIAPQQIENLLKESRFISQSMVVGENRKFPAALIVPAFGPIKDYFREKGIRLSSNQEMVANPEVNGLIASEINQLNEHLGHYARIKNFVLLADEWSLSGGELTPTLKLKRRQLLAKYVSEINSLYDPNQPKRPVPQELSKQKELLHASRHGGC
jgi:long-chain acyl-CoA synthetase